MAENYTNKVYPWRRTSQKRTPPQFYPGTGIGTGTGSTGAYSWQQDKEDEIGRRRNPWAFTGGNPNVPGDFEGVNFNDPLAKFNLTNDPMYQFGSSRTAPWAKDPTKIAEAAAINKITNPPGMMDKLKLWAGDHPMDAAKIGLGIWGGIQKQQAMGQQQQYLDDVRAAMAFDQADVDRRWNLAMGDYRVREEDQNQFRASQGMENKKTNFTV